MSEEEVKEKISPLEWFLIITFWPYYLTKITIRWWIEYLEDLGVSTIFDFYLSLIYQILFGNIIEYFREQKREFDERKQWFLELGFDPFYGKCKRSILEEWRDANREQLHEERPWYTKPFWWSFETQLQMAQTLTIILINRWKCLTFLAFTSSFDFIYISFLITFKISGFLAYFTWILTKWFVIIWFNVSYWLWEVVGLIPFKIATKLKYSWVSWLLGPLEPYSYEV